MDRRNSLKRIDVDLGSVSLRCGGRYKGEHSTGSTPGSLRGTPMKQQPMFFAHAEDDMDVGQGEGHWLMVHLMDVQGRTHRVCVNGTGGLHELHAHFCCRQRRMRLESTPFLAGSADPSPVVVTWQAPRMTCSPRRWRWRRRRSTSSPLC
jgi:hypothetical protein